MGKIIVYQLIVVKMGVAVVKCPMMGIR